MTLQGYPADCAWCLLRGSLALLHALSQPSTFKKSFNITINVTKNIYFKIKFVKTETLLQLKSEDLKLIS